MGTSEKWRGFRYKWNDDASDAFLLRDRETLAFLTEDPEAEGGSAEQSYLFPGPEDCKLCHTEAAGWVLGLQTAQINRLRD